MSVFRKRKRKKRKDGRRPRVESGFGLAKPFLECLLEVGSVEVLRWGDQAIYTLINC